LLFVVFLVRAGLDTTTRTIHPIAQHGQEQQERTGRAEREEKSICERWRMITEEETKGVAKQEQKRELYKPRSVYTGE
jgi:hypothetical protein